MRLALALLFLYSLAWAETPPTGLERLKAVGKKLGVRILVQPTKYELRTLHGDLCYDVPPKPETEAYAGVLAEEFARYPADFIKRSGLRGIVLGSRLTFDGQKRSALPDRNRWYLVYDVTVKSTKAYRRHVIHHEYFHLIDWVGTSYRWRQKQWNKLNPEGFKYGKGGKDSQADSLAWYLSTGTKGFLNRYSKSHVTEDMAEVYAFVLTQPGKVAVRAKRDKIVAAKVEMMKDHLKWFDSSARQLIPEELRDPP
ncbi:MAG: putative zinc-binding metallopeptidase, partial [Planctomycetota bacterium]